MYNEKSVPECTYMERVHVKGHFQIEFYDMTLVVVVFSVDETMYVE